MADDMSESIGEIAAGLARAQAGMGKLVAGKTATVKGKAKGSGKAYDYTYTYANLADALEACRATLNAEGIAVIQMPATPERNGITVTTMLAHSSGQWIRSRPLFMPVSGGAQDVGSAITYGRRYQLLAMVGLAPEDDDGKKAQGAKPDTWDRSKRSPTRPAQAVRPIGNSKKGAPVVKAIEARLVLLGEDMASSWASALAGAEVDLSKYPNNWPDRAQALDFKDGGRVSSWLKLELGRRGIEENAP